MEQIPIVESVIILNFIDSMFSEILNIFSNKNCSKKNILIFRIGVISFAIKAEVEENKTYIEQISSRIKKLISCSDIWKTNLKICKKTLDINNDESENIDFLFKLEISDKFNINIYADKLNQSNEVLVLGNCLEYIDFIEILDNKIIKYRNELEIQKKYYQDLYLNGFMETGENIFKIEFLSKKINISRNPKYTVPKKSKKYKRKPF